MAVFRRQESARHNFRLGFDLPRVLVDGNDRHDDAVLGEVLAVANDEFLDLFERAGIDADASGGHRFATVGGVVGEFDRLAVFDQQNFFGDRADRVRQRGSGGTVGGIRRGSE